MKTLWIVSGGVESIPAIQRARRLGLHVVVSDGNPEAPGLQWAHDSIGACTYDADATLREARRYHSETRPIDGVICVAADVPMTAARLAEEFKLTGISVRTASLASDKLAMKQRLSADRVPIPWFQPVQSVAQLRQLVKRTGLPVVLKPVDSRGARGVLRLTPEVDVDWAFHHAQGFSPMSRVMVEEYLNGPQVSTESLFCDGTPVTLGFSDRNYECLNQFAPYMIENGGHQPSCLTPQEQVAVTEVAERAAKTLGITAVSAKGDMVLTSQGPKVIEMAARLSGGWFCTHQIPLATGVDFLGAALRLSLGERVLPEEVAPRHHKGVAIRYLFPEPGKVVAIQNNLAQLRELSWVKLLRILVRPGDLLEPVTDHTKRAGFVLTMGETRQQAVERAEQIVNDIRIDTVSP